MKQGPRSSPRDQGGIQNYATGTISSNNVHQRISSPRANLKEVLWILTPKPLLKGHAKNGLGKNTHYGGTLCDWKTTLHLNIANGSLTSRSVSITRGIIQGGSLSHFSFALHWLPPPPPKHTTQWEQPRVWDQWPKGYPSLLHEWFENVCKRWQTSNLFTQDF